MKLNDKGFSAVAVLLVLVIVGIVAGTGWYVWKQKQNQNQLNSSETSQKQSEDQLDQEEFEETPIAFDMKGDIVKQGDEDKIQKLIYVAPIGWQRNTQAENEWATYYSPDYLGTLFANGHSVTQGGEINVSAYKQDDPMTIREMVEAEAVSYFSFEKYTKIDGVEAIEGTCGHFGQATCLATVYKGYYYEIGYRQVDKDVKDSKTPDNKYVKEFAELVKSLKFE